MATEEFYFSCAIRFKNVFATGNVVFRDNEFSGAFAYDYLEGLLTDGTLEFNLYEAIGLNNTIFENPKKQKEILEEIQNAFTLRTI